MKIFEKLTGKLYGKVFDTRSDIAPGIRYFDETHFDGLIKEDFSFNNDNDITLRGGFYHYKTYDKNTLVIFNHGIGGGHQAYMKEIDYIAKNGFKVLAVDYMGCVLSDGSEMGGITQPLKDMSFCVDLIKNDYKNIYVIGHSWGGFVSQGLTALHPEIKKVVLLAGLNSLRTMLEQILKFPVNLLINTCCKLEKDKYGPLSESSAAINLNRTDLSGLYIQSRDDSILNPKYNIDLVKSQNTNKNIEFIYVDEKNHNPEYTKDAVIKLNAYLKKLKKIKSIEEKEKLADSINWDELCELDNNIMDRIVEFLKK